MCHCPCLAPTTYFASRFARQTKNSSVKREAHGSAIISFRHTWCQEATATRLVFFWLFPQNVFSQHVSSHMFDLHNLQHQCHSLMVKPMCTLTFVLHFLTLPHCLNLRYCHKSKDSCLNVSLPLSGPYHLFCQPFCKTNKEFLCEA